MFRNSEPWRFKFMHAWQLFCSFIKHKMSNFPIYYNELMAFFLGVKWYWDVSKIKLRSDLTYNDRLFENDTNNLRGSQDAQLLSHEPPLLMYHNFGVYTLNTHWHLRMYSHTTYNESSTVSYTKHFCYQYRFTCCQFWPVIWRKKTTRVRRNKRETTIYSKNKKNKRT